MNLYTAEPVDLKCQDWLLNQLDTTLTSENQEKCEGALALSKCSEALSQMQTNKSPGVDGFPVEFYRRFWSSLGQDLVEVPNYSYEHGQLSDSQKQGIIRLLYKKDDPLLLKTGARSLCSTRIIKFAPKYWPTDLKKYSL